MMGEGTGGRDATAVDYQTMLKKVQETNYHTSIDEQMEVKSMGWDINVPPADLLTSLVEAEGEPV
jgi:hypothetical protein